MESIAVSSAFAFRAVNGIVSGWWRFECSLSPYVLIKLGCRRLGWNMRSTIQVTLCYGDRMYNCREKYMSVQAFFFTFRSYSRKETLKCFT